MQEPGEISRKLDACAGAARLSRCKSGTYGSPDQPSPGFDNHRGLADGRATLRTIRSLEREFWGNMQRAVITEAPMTRIRSEADGTPELMLEKATLARDSEGRAKYARRGLGLKGGLDQTTRAMLLRQLYLSHIESRRFEVALTIALEMVDTGVMADVAHQDAARACLGLERRQEAIEHLRIASRVSPPSRRAFHLWTLGSVLYLAGQERHSLGPLSRAVRWGTNDKPLYQAQVVLAQLACGETVSNVLEVRERLADSACGRGYGQFVLGELAFCEGDFAASEDYLSAFVERTGRGRVAQQVALEGELRRARDLLGRMAEKRRLA